MRLIKSLATIAAAAIAGTACSGDESSDDAPIAATPAECVTAADATEPVNTGSAAGDLIELSQEVFSCAPTVVVADDDAAITAAAGAQFATALDAPLLLPHPNLADELSRLATSDVYVLSNEPVAEDEPTTSAVIDDMPEVAVHHVSAAAAFHEAADVLGTSAQVSLAKDGSAVGDTVTAMTEGDRVVMPATDADADVLPDFAIELSDVVDLPQTPGNDTVWLVEASDPASVLPISAMATTAGASVIPIDGSDLLGYPETSGALGQYDELPAIRPIGDIPNDADWELNLLATGHRLPSGGHELFSEDAPHRFIAYYGHPDTSGMGVLGKQDGPEATYKAMRSLLDDYDTGDATVVPTFNPIATVAHNGGSTGKPDDLFDANQTYYVDYSVMHPPQRFAEYVEFAEEIDGYVVLDFQPGRNDFLYQVQAYEELLRHPQVGVALDPEWRLGSGERHLTQIGSVSAKELNKVIDWLADLVRDEGLPQKVVMLHQFRTDMITDRDDLVDREEIELVIQMDGEGQNSLAQKDDTYRAITDGAEDGHWRWGWKNFTERDTPRPNTPKETLSKDPQPVYISYQ